MSKSSGKNLARTLAVVVFVLLAAAIAFGILPKLYAKEEAKTTIVMLKQDVPAGTLIDETMLAYVEVGSYGLNGTVLHNAEDVIGKYAIQYISAKDLLFPEKFSVNPIAGVTEEPAPDIVMNDNQMLLTLALSSTAAGGAGKITAGDIVNTAVYAPKNTDSYNYYSNSYDSEAEAAQPATQDNVLFPAILQGLTVYRVQTAQLTNINPNAEVATSTNNNRIPVYITLIVNQEQADMLLDYNYSNTVHFLATNAD